MTPESITTKPEEIKALRRTSLFRDDICALEDTLTNSLTNFPRNGPQRKVFLFGYSFGDHEWEEE
jgi:hypothetical protein